MRAKANRWMWNLVGMICVGAWLVMGCAVQVEVPPGDTPPGTTPPGTTTPPGKKDTNPPPKSRPAPVGSDWLLSWGGSGSVQVTSVKSADGASYVLGHFENRATFGSFTLKARRRWGVFVAKIERDGSFAWVRSIATNPPPGGTERVVTEVDIALVRGPREVSVLVALNTAQGELQFDGEDFQSTGHHPWVLHMNADAGKLLWSKPLKDIARLHAIATNLYMFYVEGRLYGQRTFGSTKLQGGGRTPYLFVGALSVHEGKERWALQGGPVFHRSGARLQISVDVRGNLLLAGQVYGKGLRIGDKTIVADTSTIPQPFVARIELNGNLLWFHKGRGIDWVHVSTESGVVLVGRAGTSAVLGGHALKVDSKDSLVSISLSFNGKIDTVQPHATIGSSVDLVATFLEGGTLCWVGESAKPLKVGGSEIQTSEELPYFWACWDERKKHAVGKALPFRGTLQGVVPGPGDLWIAFGTTSTKARFFDKTWRATAPSHLFVGGFARHRTSALWVAQSQGAGQVEPLQMEAFSDGSHAVLVRVAGRVRLGDQEVYTQGEAHNHLFVVDASGKIKWQAPFPGDRFAVGANDTVAWAGHTTKAMELSASHRVKADHLFVATWDRNGKVQRVRQWSMKDAPPSHVVLDRQGHLYMGGLVTSDFQIGNRRVQKTQQSEIYLARLSVEGKVLWIARGGSPKYNVLQALSVDREGRLFALGVFFGDDVTFGDRKISSERGSLRHYLVTLDPKGSFVGVSVASQWQCKELQLIPAPQRGILVTGLCPASTAPDSDKQHRAFVAKVKTDATLAWVREAKSKEAVHVGSAAVDSQGEVVLFGHYEGTMQLGDQTLQSQGDRDLWVARLNPKGEVEKVHSLGGRHDDTAAALNLHNQRLILLGRSRSSFALGTSNLTSQGENQLFLLRTKADDL